MQYVYWPWMAQAVKKMLKGISPIVFPELLKVLSEMGHGDEIVLADAHFPGHSLNTRVRQLNVQVLDCYEREFKNVYYNRESCCG